MKIISSEGRHTSMCNIRVHANEFIFPFKRTEPAKVYIHRSELYKKSIFTTWARARKAFEKKELRKARQLKLAVTK